MNRFIAILLLFGIIGCGSKKRTANKRTSTVTVEAKEGEQTRSKKTNKKAKVNSKADLIISTAMTFTGTRYKFGGTTKRGMDCSGLVFVSLQKHGISFPRVSYQMANEGQRIKLDNVQKGDLLFFKTGKNRKRINHVGLVVNVEGDEIKFIHSSSSRGVIVSSLREGFWNHTFVKATRIL